MWFIPMFLWDAKFFILGFLFLLCFLGKQRRS